MKYLLIAIINVIYGILMLLTLDVNTPGFFLVLIIGAVLTLIGLAGFILWLRMVITSVKDEPNQDQPIKNWFGLVKSFDIVLIIGLLFRAFIMQPYIVEGNSMEVNFHDKEILIVDKTSYKFRSIHRGETVIFQAPKSPQDDYIKRIIAFPGETVAIQNGKVKINGKILEEPYLPQGATTLTSDKIFRLTLGPDQYFVMGDNRGNSSDSREWGVLPKVNVIGRAWLVVSPFSQKGIVPKFSPLLQ